MDFKFNFNIGDHTTEKTSHNESEQRPANPDAKSEFIHNGSAKRIQVDDVLKYWSSKSSSYMYEAETVSVSTEVGKRRFVVVSPANNGQDQDTDLVPSSYEGGFKIWECTLDLADYLAENQASQLLKDKTVLDLGCGVGVLGIYALIFGFCAKVTFQDFNESVIMESTGPSSFANLYRHKSSLTCTQDGSGELFDETQRKKAKVDDSELELSDLDTIFQDNSLIREATDKIDFVAGDWGTLASSSVISGQYDVILSSETIYNISSYGKLHDLLEACLSPNGTVLMSAKSHYFSVGGGIESWFDFVAKRNVFCVEIVRSTKANLQRQIFRMNFKDKSKS